MTKLRTPLTTEAALTRIADRVGGYEAMAAAAGRTPGHLRNCANPDKPEDVTLGVAIALDLAYRAAGGEGAPLHESQAMQLELADADRFACRHELLGRAARVIQEGGEAHAALVRLGIPGATEAQRREAYRQASEAHDELRAILPLLRDLPTDDPSDEAALAHTASALADAFDQATVEDDARTDQAEATTAPPAPRGGAPP